MPSQNQKNDSKKMTSVALAIIISIISMIFSFLSIEHEYFFSLPPFLISGIEEFDCAIRKDERETSGMTYIFVLDTSTSYNTQKVNPAWFYYQRKKINDFLAAPGHDFGSTQYSKPPLFMLCKVKLCQAILEFRHENANFEIWTLGNDAAKHYSGKFGDMVSLEKAIRKIVDIPQTSLNTDFVSLFKRVFKKHQDLNLMKAPPTEHNLPGVVMIVVSDLLHDVKRKFNLNPNKGKLDEQERDLDNIIDKISSGNILVDIIELKPLRIQEHEIPVWEILNRNKFLDSRLKKVSIENDSIEPLFPTINSHNRIIFFYNYAASVLKSSVYLKFDKIGNYSIGLDPYKNKKSLKYEVVNVTSGKEMSAGKAGNFIAGGNFVQFKDLKPYESIKLTCGTSSPLEGFPDLKISLLDKEKINYSIPIVFNKKPLPLKQNIYIWSIFILLSLIFFLVIQLFCRIVRFLKLKFRIYAKRKEKLALKPQEGAANVSVTDAPIDKDNLVPCPYPECPSNYHTKTARFCPISGKFLGRPSRIKKRLLITSLVLIAIIVFIIVLLNIVDITAKPTNLTPNEGKPIPVKVGKPEIPINSEFNPINQNAGSYNEPHKPTIPVSQTTPEESIPIEIEKPKPPVKTVDFSKFPSEIKNKYNKKMGKIQDVNFPEIDEIKNQTIYLVFSVDEKGNVIVVKVFQKGISVSRDILERAKGCIQKKIRQIPFFIPTDENGNPIKVVNWELEFKVIKYKGKMTIRRK